MMKMEKEIERKIKKKLAEKGDRRGRIASPLPFLVKR